jgi:hypothetical protein
VVAERFEVDEKGGATLEVTSTYRRYSADNARADHSDAQPRVLDRRYRNFYSRQFPSIRSARLPRLEDDRVHNRFVVHEQYQIADFWRDQQVSLHAHLIDDELEEPKVRLRKAPLALPYPVNIEHRIEVLLPRPFDIEPLDDRVERDGVSFHRVVKRADRLVSMQYTFTTTARDLAPQKVAAHLAALEQVGNSLDYQLTDRPAAAPAPAPVPAERHSPWLATVVGLGVVCLIIGGVIWIVFGAVLQRAQAQPSHRQAPPAAGETAAGAIEIGDVEQAGSAGERVPCGCGGRLSKPATTTFETARLGDHEVHSARFVCGRCGRLQPLYFRVRPSS